MHASSDALQPRRTFESFFLELRHVRLVFHARVTSVLRSVANATRRHGIGVEISGEIYRCPAGQTQGSCSLAR